MNRSRTPVAFVVLALVGAAFVGLPLLGLLVRTPWTRVFEVFSRPGALQALRLSLVVATAAAALCLVLGLPLAWVLARASFPGKTLLRGLVILPLVMPPVVAGVALLSALGRRGVVGAPLFDALGVQVTFTTVAAVLAAAFVSLPLAVLALEAGLRSIDTRLEDAASTLGASRSTVLRRVTFPLLGPQIVAALVLSWARALGEFGATITFAGNLPGRTQTLPLAVFETLQTDPEGAIALSLLLVVVSLVVIVGLRARFLSVPGS